MPDLIRHDGVERQCPPPPISHPKTPRAKKLAVGSRAVRVSGNNPDLRGAGDRPVVVEEVDWRNHPRPTGEGHMRLPGAYDFLPAEALTQSRTVRCVRLNRQPNPPLPARSRPRYRPA